MTRLVKFSLSLALGLLSSACDQADEQTRGRRAIGEFHDLYNENRYSDIYHGADPALRKSVTETEFSQHLARIKKDFGNYNELNDGYHFPVQATPEAGILKISVKSHFEKSKCAEEFEFKNEGGLRLLEYKSVRDDRPR